MTRHANPVAGHSSLHSTFKFKTLSLAVAACLGSIAPVALANPTGATVANGNATFVNQGNTLTVTNNNGTVINWQQFNIGANETTRFLQPNAQSTVLNRVVGVDPSQIMGTLQSNGQVFLINPNGIVFGKSAIIDVPGLIASTLNLSDSDFLARKFNFSGGGFGPLVNQGRISTPLGGSVMLIGSDVRNEGVITTPQGQVVLAAGKSVSLVDTAGPELSVTLTASGNKAVNLGEINASGGKIDIFGALIEQQGILRADSASVDEQGRIVLKATESTTVSGAISATNSAGQGGSVQVLGKDVTLTATANIDASGTAGGGQILVGGDWQGKNPSVANAQTTTMQAGAVIKADATASGNGGKVVLWSDNRTDFKGDIFARGGANGGNGGQVETSGRGLLLGGRVDTRAPKGVTGFWLLDPAVVCFDTGSCSGAYDPMSHGYTTADVANGVVVYVTPSALDGMMLTANVQLYASDYAALLPNGGVYTAPVGTPAGTSVYVSAPHVFINGTFDFQTNNVQAHVNLLQQSNPSASFPSAAGLLFGSGAKLLLPQQVSGASSYSNVMLSGSSMEFVSGSEIRMPFTNPAGTNSYSYNGGLQVTGPATGTLFVKNGGVNVHAPYMNLSFYDIDQSASTAPWNLTVNDMIVSVTQPGGMLIGPNACTGTTQACVDDVSHRFAGSIPHINLSYSGGDIHWAGAPVLPASTINLNVSSGGSDQWIDSATSFSLSDGIMLGGRRIYVNAPFSNTAGFIAMLGSDYVKVNAPMTGSSTDDIALIGNILWISSSVEAETVYLHAGAAGIGGAIGTGAINLLPGASIISTGGSYTDTYGSVHPGIELLLENGASLDNQEGASVFRTTAAGGILSLVQQSPTSGSISWGGFTTSQKTLSEFSTLLCGPSISCQQYQAANYSNANLYIGDLGGTPTTPPSSLTDPCLLNPSSCSVNSSNASVVTATQTATPVAQTTTLSAPLSIDSKQTLTTDNGSATQTTAVQESKLTVKSAGDTGAAELKVEARKARDEAGKAESEAKKAEAEAKKAESEAKQAEAEAKAAKTPAEKAAAKQKVEAKKAEAEAKKAEAEAKKAEAQAKQAEADSHEAQAEAANAKNGAATPVAAKQAQTEAKQAQAEAKQAQAEARKAEAESKQAAVEAKSAKTPEQKAIAQKTAEAKKTEAEAKKTEAQAKQAEAEAKKAEAEAKTAKTPEQKAAAEKRAEAKKTEAEVKKSEAESKQAQAEGKQAEAKGKQAEAEAKQAEAEAKKAEADAKAAKTPEQKAVAEKKADVKKTEAEAKKAEGEAKKTEADAKRTEAEAKKAEAEAKKAEAEAKTAKSSTEKAAAEKKAETKKTEAEVKKAETEAKKTEADAKQAKAESKQAEAEAKDTRSPGGRAVAEKQAEAKKAEAEHKQADAERKQAEAQAKKAEVEAKRAEAEGRKGEAQAKRAEAQTKKAEVEAKRAEAEKKRIEAEKKAEEHRLAETKRKEERRVESAKAFASVVTAGANRAALEELAVLRHQLKTETFKPALNVLKANPAAADLPPCSAGSTVCIPAAPVPQAAVLSLPMPPVPKFAALPQIQRKVAVVIGVNKYSDPSIPSLDSALPDAQAVGQQLQEQLGYDVRVVPNATRADIVTNLNKLSQEVGPNDSVTVYYAGHGYLSDKTKTGYWIPADAKVTSPDNWISNSDIGKLLSNIPAKQVMLVSDSCYSGSLTKEQKITGAAGTLDPSGILSKRSVTVMSSGGEEPVSDEGKEGHSIFAYSFMSALKSVKQVDAGAKLFENVRNEVSKDFPQTPQYGGAVSAGHAPGGDYLFETRSYK
ncbi:MAG TPA: caspase family protein [Rhodocyclaceae bacterium]|nr:caspase family protein [Rhodocyclaceae bacterium]